VEWQVVLMTRGTHSVSKEQHLPEQFREGWLLFQAGDEKRRFAPPPANWEALSDAELVGLLDRATPQTVRAREHGAPEEAKPIPVDRRTAAQANEPLGPQLRDVEQKVEESLGEVCEKPPVSRLDTGELIRVEETLAIAAQAAKEAVSLRRRMRADEERDHPGTGADGSSELRD